MNPWEKGYSPKPLDPRLYSETQCRAAAGLLPKDHPAWTLTADFQPTYTPTPDRDQQGSDSPAVTSVGPMWPGACPPCGRTWQSITAAHCPTCHRHFSTAAGFGLHRRDGRCVDPAELTGYRAMRQVERSDGAVWVRLYDGPERVGRTDDADDQAVAS